MNPTQFKTGFPGALEELHDQRLGRYHAFVPAPLPPETIEWTATLARRLADANRELGTLIGVGSQLPNPHMLLGPFQRREAVASSRIEGTITDLSQLVLFEAGQTSGTAVDDTREVWNYVHALEYGLERVQALPVSKRLIRELHEKLLRHVRGEDQAPGEFRTRQAWIGAPGCDVQAARFVPPPANQVEPALDAFEGFLHARSELPPLVRLALVHYQFEAIHPFSDGNGRVGRLLLILLLCTEKIMDQPLLYLSAFFDRHRQEYYDGLLNVSLMGDWNAWIEFFLVGVEEQARESVELARQLLGLRAQFHDTVMAARNSALLLKLVDALFERPYTTGAMATQLLSVTPRSALKNIEKLELAGILREATGRKRDRVWVADAIIQVAS